MPGQVRADLALLEIGNEDAIDATRDCSKSSCPGALNSGAATCLQPGATGSWRAGDREGSFLLAGSRALSAAAQRFYNHTAAAVRATAPTTQGPSCR
jgi:hypothetical protein